MENYLKTYTVELKTVGPVYIGSGVSIGKKEYVYIREKKLLYVMDIRKMYQGLARRRLLQEYEAYMMERRAPGLGDFLRRMGISEREFSQWSSYQLKMNDVEIQGQSPREIQAFVKDPYGCPYIPGSSLKGALRTAVESAIILEDRELKNGGRQAVREDTGRKRRKWQQADQKVRRKVFHSEDGTGDRTEDRAEGRTEDRAEGRTEDRNDSLNDKMAGIRISDSSPLSVDDLTLCQKIDQNPEAGQRKLNILRECIRPGTVVTFDLTVDTKRYPTSGERLMKQMRSAYKNYEKKFLSAFPGTDQASGPARGNLAANIKAGIAVQPRTFLVLGGGAGYPSKSIMYALFDRREAVNLLADFFRETTPKEHKHYLDSQRYQISPHTRKITRYKRQVYDMGLCEVVIREK